MRPTEVGIPEMMPFTLRPARYRDLRSIRRLIWRVRINVFGLEWRRFVVVETAGGDFVGCGQLKPHADGSVELASIAVVERFRGLGAARLVIDHLIAAGSLPLFLMCLPKMVPFYEQFGFRTALIREMPPTLRRFHRFAHRVGSITRREAPVIMRLD